MLGSEDERHVYWTSRLGSVCSRQCSLFDIFRDLLLLLRFLDLWNIFVQSTASISTELNDPEL